MKLAIVGLGELGVAWYRAIQSSSTISIVGMIDEELSDEVGVSLSLADAFLLCTPQDKQEVWMKRLSDTGKMIIVPLPFCTSLASCRKIIEGNKGIFPAIFQSWDPCFLDLKHHIEQGDIGDIGMIEIRHIAPVPRQNWYQALNISGGARYQLLLTDLVLLEQLAGPIVEYHLNYRQNGGKDYCTCSMSCASGALATIECFWGGNEPFLWSFEASGTKGNIVINGEGSRSIRFFPKVKEKIVWNMIADDSHQYQFRNCIEAVACGEVQKIGPSFIRLYSLLDVQGGGA